MSEHEPTPERIEVPIDEFTVGWELRSESISAAKQVLDLANAAIKSYGIELVATFNGEEADDEYGGKHDNITIDDDETIEQAENDTIKPKLTYLDLVRLSIERARLNQTHIDDETARVIALCYAHEESHLFQFAADGAISDQMFGSLLATYQQYEGNEEAQIHLNYLGQYLALSGNREAVEGWNFKWLRGSDE